VLSVFCGKLRALPLARQLAKEVSSAVSAEGGGGWGARCRRWEHGHEVQMGLLMHLLFLFNRKTTISKNALKLSSKTLSSLTERSECVGYFFLKKIVLFLLTSLRNQSASA